MKWRHLRWSNLLYALFAVTFIAAGSIWFLQNFELKQVDAYTGYKGEARSNSLFAARLFLKRMGIPAERHDGLTELPPNDTVIILNTERYSLSNEKTEELLDWVARGGHLITRARTDVDSLVQAEAAESNEKGFSTENRDLLQDTLDISIGPHIMPDDDLPILFKPANSEETLSIELDFFNSLNTTRNDTIHYQLENDTWFMDQPYGKGHVSLLTSLDFFENHSLNSVDHGKMLWYLVHSHKAEPKQVWLLHQDTLPSLITLLLRHAAPLVFACALLLLFAFWALIPRFGAIIPEPPPQRRRILDHIKASGQFLWKRQDKGREQLCHTLQHSIDQLAQQRIPGWQLMPAEQQHVALAEFLQFNSSQHTASAASTPQRNSGQKSGRKHEHKPFSPQSLNSGNLQQLLSANTLDEQNFTSLVQLAQYLRNPI